MNDYDKNSFYSHIDDSIGKRRFYIKVGKRMIEVSKDIYYVCYNSYRKQLRDNKRDELNNLISLDYKLEGGYEISEVIGKEEQYLDDIYSKDLISLILKTINELDNEDKELITELLINEKEGKELAKSYNLSKQAISKRKKKIIKKILKKIK